MEEAANWSVAPKQSHYASCSHAFLISSTYQRWFAYKTFSSAVISPIYNWHAPPLWNSAIMVYSVWSRLALILQIPLKFSFMMKISLKQELMENNITTLEEKLQTHITIRTRRRRTLTANSERACVWDNVRTVCFKGGTTITLQSIPTKRP